MRMRPTAPAATLGVRLAAALGRRRRAPVPRGLGGRRVAALAEMRSDSASRTLETTNTTWMTTSQNRSRSDTVLIDMNCFKSWIAEMATIDHSSLIFSAVKSIVPIHSGQSRCRLWSILETKFS